MSLVSICEGWEGRTVDGKFPLLEWLGGSKDRGVFLTVRQGIQTASIKLILAGVAEAEAYLAQWEAAKSLSHPNLTRVMETGRYTIDGNDLVYVVTERAEAVLSGIIPRKALDPDKTRAIANRVGDALSYVHDKGLVHGRVKPSNILLAGDEWKLSGDCVHAVAEAAEKVQQTGLYDAPEVAEGRVLPASDVWSLGVIMAEALTQLTPIRDSAVSSDPAVPRSMPQPFRDIVRGCLRVSPAERYRISQVLTLLAIKEGEASAQAAKPESIASNSDVFKTPQQRRGLGATQTSEEPAYPFGKVEPVEPAPPAGLFADLDDEEDESRMRVAPFVFGLTIVLAIGAVLLLRGDRWKQWKEYIPNLSAPAASRPATPTPAPAPTEESQSAPPAGQAAQQAAAPAGTRDQSQSGAPTEQAGQALPSGESAHPAPKTEARTPSSSDVPKAGPDMKGPETDNATLKPESTAKAPTEANAKGAVVERILPNVSSGATSAMRGPVQVEVRVNVNEDGKVSNAEYMSHGPGNYFARISHDAARSWKFKPPVKDGQPISSIWTLRFHFDRKKTEATATEIR